MPVRKLSTAELVASKPSLKQFRAQPRFPIHVICDDVRSLDNVGIIFRLCDAARVERLYLCGITGYPPLPDDPRPPHVAERARRRIAKTAIHNVDYVPWSRAEHAVDVALALKSSGVQLVAVEQTAESVDYVSAPYRLPLCLILGHERDGISQAVLDHAELAISIPIYGMGNSLNVASALAVVLYELIRGLIKPPA